MSALWNASVAAGPYVLCILLAAVAIYGLAWVMDNMPAAGLDPYAEAFGDDARLPEEAKAGTKKLLTGGGAATDGHRPSNSHSSRPSSHVGQGGN